MQIKDDENVVWVPLQSLFAESEYSPMNQERPFTKFEAKIWLLAHANCAEHQVGDVTVEPGQILTSVRSLARVWRWNHTKVHRFLIDLERDGWIERYLLNHRTLIAIHDERDDGWSKKRDSEWSGEQDNEMLVFKPNFDQKKSVPDSETPKSSRCFCPLYAIMTQCAENKR